MSPVPTVDVDLRDPDVVADPYPELARLRTAAPVVRQRSTGVLLVTTHASVTGVLRDRTWGGCGPTARRWPGWRRSTTCTDTR